MNRRELLTMIAAVTGTAMIGTDRAFAYRPTETGPNAFSPEDAAFLDEVAEVFIPKTDTPGAKEAGVGAFMTVYVSDCYTGEEQRLFKQAMDDLKRDAEEGFGKPFMEMSPEERLSFYEEASADAAEQIRVIEEARERRDQTLDVQPAADTASSEATEGMASRLADLHWFTAMQQLTLFGFFTSEAGATEVLRYEAVPGSYDGDVPYEGEAAWAT